MRSSVVVAALLAGLVAPSVAAADDRAPAHAETAKDAELARLLEAKDTLRWTQLWAGQRYGHAETLVRAPFESVKKELADLGRFHQLHDRFAGARVVARVPERTDLYLPLLSATPKETGNEVWEILRFGTPRTTTGYAVVEGRATAGNTRQGHLVMSARQVDDKHTIVKVDILVVPNRALEATVLDEQMRTFASDLAGGLRRRAQGTSEPVTSLRPEPIRVSSR